MDSTVKDNSQVCRGEKKQQVSKEMTESDDGGGQGVIL